MSQIHNYTSWAPCYLDRERMISSLPMIKGRNLIFPSEARSGQNGLFCFTSSVNQAIAAVGKRWNADGPPGLWPAQLANIKFPSNSGLLEFDPKSDLALPARQNLTCLAEWLGWTVCPIKNGSRVLTIQIGVYSMCRTISVSNILSIRPTQPEEGAAIPIAASAGTGKPSTRNLISQIRRF